MLTFSLALFQCPGGTFTPGLRTTREFSDELVTFVRAHPLMYNAVYPLQRQPLLVRTNVPYSFTTLAVDLVDAVDGRYEVLFLGTGMPRHLCLTVQDSARHLVLGCTF